MLIVGLGNIGLKYKNTYHNVGFCVADALANSLGFKFRKTDCMAKIAEGNYLGNKVYIAKPETYMNLSGESVRSLMQKYGFEAGDVMIVYDDIDLPQGAVRARASGSGGTHNGMRNVVSLCGELPRVRVGIGKPQSGDLADYVLSKLSKEGKSLIMPAVQKVADALQKYITDKDISALERTLN